MALSIITINGSGPHSHGLYCSLSRKIIMAGMEPELAGWKHDIETQEQLAANREHFGKLRVEYMAMLISGHNTPEQAEALLRERMPCLFE